MAERKPTPDILGDLLGGKPATKWPQEIDYPIDRIIIGKRLRPLRQDYGDLRDSMQRNGLLNRVVLLPDGTLVAGRHRVASARDLGWPTIPAKIVEMDAVDAELAEIDENLSRIELTVLEQAEHLLRREELLEAKGVRAKAGDNQFADGGGETISPPLATTATIANTMGISERSAQQRLQIARNLSPEVRELVRNTELADSTTQLLELSRMATPKQRTIADMLIAGKAANVVEAARKLDPAPAPVAPAAPAKTSYWSPIPSTDNTGSNGGSAVVISSTGGSRQQGAELARCTVCHRPLSDPASAVAGVGPCCAAKRAAAAAGDGDVGQEQIGDSNKYFEIISNGERIALVIPLSSEAIQIIRRYGMQVNGPIGEEHD